MTRAVVYLRRSSAKQEKSIDDQRVFVQQYAGTQGYEIVGEYIDDAISGDDNKARDAFWKMRDDLVSGKIAEFVLVWAYDRISRNDSDEESAAMFPLREAGVVVDSVTEGLIDRESFEGRITHVVKQEGRHNFLRDLAKNSLRGRLNAAKRGHLAGQAAPYGFDRMIVDDMGQHVMRVKNGEPRPTRGGSTHVSLVESDDSEVVETLRWIFDYYANNDVGLRTVADILNRKGILGPRGGAWYPNTISHILRNEAYVGTFVYAKRTEAKFYRIAGDTIQPRPVADYRQAKVRKNDESQHVRVPGAFPSLVDAETFSSAGSRLRGRKRTGRSRRKQPDRYSLSGLVVCGCCGHRMSGVHKTRRKDRKTYEYSRYVCSTYLKHGDAKKYVHGCFHCQVGDGALTELVTKKLQENVLKSQNLKKLEAAIRRQLSKRPPKHADSSGLQKKLGRLNSEIDRAADRLLRAGDDLVDILSPKLRSLRQERDRIAERLQAEATPDIMGKPQSTEAVVKSAMDRLQTLSNDLRSTSAERRRHVLQSMIHSVTLEFEQTEKNGRTFSKLKGGVIELSNAVIRDDKI